MTRRSTLSRLAIFAAATATLTGWQLLHDLPVDASEATTAQTEVATPTPERLLGRPITDIVPPPEPRDPTEALEPLAARSAGASWLEQHQAQDGGWGGGSFRGTGSHGAARSDVATTALAVMALLRDDPRASRHREAIERGVDFVLRSIERSPQEGPLLSGPQNTQPQYKLGRNVDTHFAALMLGEVTGKLSPGLEARTALAYDKVLTKVVAAQQDDGSFDRDGWAPVLSSSVAAQSLYKALENGKQLPEAVLEKTDAYQSRLVDSQSGTFDTSEGAGVALYAAASGLIGNAQAARRPSAAAPEAEAASDIAARAFRSDGGALLRGFGSVGGEEMLSYLMVSDTMAQEGGEGWEAWQQKIGRHLSISQNADGSWSGHHCITSTPFVTAAAVMTLGAAPPLAEASGRETIRLGATLGDE